MAEHRVPMLSPALHRPPDPEHSRDPRIRALVGQLRTLEVAPARARSSATSCAPNSSPSRRASSPRANTPRCRRRRARPRGDAGRRRSGRAGSAPDRPGSATSRVGRPLAVLTCVVAVFAVLLGGAVWISKRALPGDALYGLKRASENLQEAMTSGDTPGPSCCSTSPTTATTRSADSAPGGAGSP